MARPGDQYITPRMGHADPYVSYPSDLGAFAGSPPEAYLFESTTRSFIRLAPGSSVAGMSAVAGDALALASAVALVPAPTNYTTDIYLVSLPRGTPAAPGSLAWSVAGTTVTLTWAAPATGDLPSEYVIAAGLQPGRTDAAILPTGSTATRFSANVPGGGTFCVRVHARNVSGTSGPSNEIRITIE